MAKPLYRKRDSFKDIKIPISGLPQKTPLPKDSELGGIGATPIGLFLKVGGILGISIILVFILFSVFS